METIVQWLRVVALILIVLFGLVSVLFAIFAEEGTGARRVAWTWALIVAINLWLIYMAAQTARFI